VWATQAFENFAWRRRGEPRGDDRLRKGAEYVTLNKGVDLAEDVAFPVASARPAWTTAAAPRNSPASLKQWA